MSSSHPESPPPPSRRARSSGPPGSEDRSAARTTITVVFALGAEWAPWKEWRAFAPVDPALVPGGTNGRFKVFTRQHPNVDIRLIECGVGPARAAACVEAALTPDVGGLLICGFAGGLRSTLAATEAIVAQRVHGPAGEPPIACDARLVALAAAAGATVIGSLITVDHIVATAAEKRALGRDHDADDMEAYPLIAAAAVRGIPAAVIRVVGDVADEDVAPELLKAMLPDGSVGVGRWVRAVLVRPWRWPAIWRLLGVHGHARRRLLVLLDRLLIAYPAEAAADDGMALPPVDRSRPR